MKKSLALGLVLLAGFAATQVLSKDETDRPREDMIKAMEAYGTPGAEHAILKKLEGNYEVHARAFLNPAEASKETVGRSAIKVVYRGLFAKEDYSGTCPFTGKSMEGVSYLGFDNAKKKYVMSWIDSLGSGIHVLDGVADGSGKVFTFEGTCPDALTGKEKKIRTVLTIVDDNKLTTEMFGAGPDGKEAKALELTYIKK